MTPTTMLLVNVPGTALALEYVRAPSGRLIAIRGGDRTYVEEQGGARVFDGGWVRVSEGALERGFLRHVDTPHGGWIEEYRWDEGGLPVHVDGVDIARDGQGRIVACVGVDAEWRYGYSGDHLAVVDGPHGTRSITRGDDGRPLVVREGGRVEPVAYDRIGARRDLAPAPGCWRRDDLGRLWAVTDAAGAVIATFLWDGFACLGRIDGPPGAPLVAVFSLDASRTPTRTIAPGGTLRIPRDAFGEALLAHHGVPGLHGGAIHRGLVYLKSRVLDPRSGSYDRPDPWHGRDDDPRRDHGYRGPLPVETATTGPYAACQYDAVSFVDPTGESTGWIILSDFTWSFVHNITGWFGMDLTLNFWLSLLGAPWGQMGQFFEFEGFSSDRTGAFATRRNGVLAGPRAFTLQHQIWSDASAFTDLDEAVVFDPGGRFEPTLYGTVLRGVPTSGAPFLLQGNLDPQPMPGTVPWTWSRSGGSAEAVVPGSNVPYFPSGGLHFDNVYRNVRGLQACPVTELVPASAAPVTATLSQSTLFADTPTPVAGLNAGDLALLTDGANLADIKTVSVVAPQGPGSRIRFSDGARTVALTGVRLRGLDPPAPGDTMSAGGPPNALSTTGSAQPFAAGDPLRLTQAGVPVGATIVDHLETQVQVDGPLPATVQTPIAVQLAALSGVATAATLAGNTLSGATLPAPGDFVAVTGSGVTLGAVVAGTAAAPTLDRTAPELAPLGAAVTWQRLVPGANLGQATVRDPGATVTYVPTAPRAAPAAASFLILRGAGASPVVAARRVGAVTYDALVLTRLPGAPATPFTVERFTVRAPDLANLALGTLTGLALSSATALPAGSVALALNLLGSPTLTAGAAIANAALNAGTATLAGAPGATPNPSQLVVLQDTATSTLEAAVVAAVLVTLRFDRPIVGLLPDARLVPLAAGGFAYAAALNADGTLTTLPTVGATAVQMPRFSVGEIVQVTGGAIAGAPLLFVVTAVSGSTLTLIGPSAPAGGPGGFTVQRLVPAAPAAQNGTPWLGTAGASVPGGPNTDVSFRMWRPNDAVPPAGTPPPLCIRSTDPTQPALAPVVVPARVASVQAVRVAFTAPPARIGANCAITNPNPQIFYAPSFTQSGVDVAIANPLPGALPAPPAAGPNLIVAVPYVPATPAIAATGTIGPGTVLCPADPENWEFDRRQALAEHELTHTVQSATFGQIYWGIWPLFAHEGLMELLSDTEQPAFSPYVDARIETVTATTVLRIGSASGFAQGATVQISAAGQATVSTVLGAPAEGGGFVLPSDLAMPAGEVRVRRKTDDGRLGIASDVVYNIFRLTSLGGIMNVAGGAMWGGVIFGIGKLAYLMSRRLFGGGQSYPASIEADGRAVRMTDAAGQAAVQGFNEIIVRSSDGSATRDVESADGPLLRLRQAVEFRGAAQVVPYKTADIWDWHDYFQATVPDASRPARIQVQPRGEKRLTLHQFDRVNVGAGTRSYRTNVTAMTADGLAELEEAPPASARAGFQIAKVDENDPIFALDSRMLSEMGVGWLRWFFDPFGQFQYRLHPERNSVWDIIARVARYGLGTHSWSWPIPGTLFLMNLFSQIGGNGHLSPLEQEASSNSGNLYSPLAKLRGGFQEVDGQFGTYAATVGDLARYWHTPFHGTGPTGNYAPIRVTQAGLQDTPGPHLQALIRVVPNATGTPGAPEPNGTVAPTNPAVAGQFVPDLLVAKNFATPDQAPAAGPTGFNPATSGLIPLTPKLNQSIGTYVGFTQPGTHRLTVADGLVQGQQGREAQRDKVQTLWFDVVVTDVTVTVAGAAVAQQSPPAQVTLVLLQQARVTVAPDGARAYALTATRPGGALLAPPSATTLAAGAAVGTDVVEVSRVYTFTPGAGGAAGSFADAVLGQHGGMHLGSTFHVPVRTFSVQVVNTLPVRTGPEPTAATTNAAVPGTPAFLLVPVDIQTPPAAAFTYPGGATPGRQDPNLAPTPEAPSATARAFLGPSGQLFRIGFDDPPEEAAQVTFTVVVRSGATTAPLTCGPITYTPHFRLLDAAGTYTVRRGLTLVLNGEAGVVPAGVTVSGTGVTAAVAGSVITLAAAADAPLGPRTVTCADAADATHRARRTIAVIA